MSTLLAETPVEPEFTATFDESEVMSPRVWPAYRGLSEAEWQQRIAAGYALFETCRACPRTCEVPRFAGEMGVCQTGTKPRIASANAHFGEEPPLTGQNGSGTVFFSHCNMRCVFCQNYPLSQQGLGDEITIPDLAGKMVHLQTRGCHNINFVTPSHVVPFIIDAVYQAQTHGLRIPIVYNSSGYDSLEALRLLDGIVDIYMPDIKYSTNAAARKYSKSPGYWDIARPAVKEMYRQVGHLQLDDQGLARRGLLIRHLVLPHDISGTREVLRFITDEISLDTHISFMSQYFPVHKAATIPELSRRLTHAEWDAAVDALDEAGLECGFVQDDPS